MSLTYNQIKPSQNRVEWGTKELDIRGGSSEPHIIHRTGSFPLKRKNQQGLLTLNLAVEKR